MKQKVRYILETEGVKSGFRNMKRQQMLSKKPLIFCPFSLHKVEFRHIPTDKAESFEYGTW